MMDVETKEWVWEAYKTCYAVLLIENVSALCCSVHRDEDDAKRDCGELQQKHPQNRYVVVGIPLEEMVNDG